MSQLQAICPMCDGNITLQEGVVEAERIMCPDCNNAVVVNKITNGRVELIEAPAVEEDWGQ